MLKDRRERNVVLEGHIGIVITARGSIFGKFARNIGDLGAAIELESRLNRRERGRE